MQTTAPAPGFTVPPADRRELRHELQEMYETYAHFLDEDQLERWPEFFTEDAFYAIISRENFDQGLPHATMYCDGAKMIRDRVVALRQTQLFEPRSLRHFISGVRIDDIARDTIHARANFWIAESLSDREPSLNMVGRYIDVLVREGRSLRFKSRQCVFDNYRIRTSLIIPV